jgi:DNA-binding response OmpR family regulator
VILDVMMPEMNGFDVAAVLKNDPATMDIPIIILSILEDKERGFRLGVDRYLTKPIDTATLFHEVDTLLDQGKSKKKVMVVDEDVSTVRTLTDVLQDARLRSGRIQWLRAGFTRRAFQARHHRSQFAFIH